MPPLKKGPKLVLFALIAIVLFIGAKTAMSHGLVPTPGFLKPAKIKTAADIAQLQDAAATGNVAKLDLPGTEPANATGPELRCEVWAWNAHTSLLYAIGGPKTTEGSLFAKAGINGSVGRQDDTEKMKSDLLAYANAYANGDQNPSTGVNCVTIMGSQAGGFFQSINPSLAKLGDKAVVITVPGRSDGEDAIMGPAAWKQSPAAALGHAIAVVPLEGDADLLKKWVKDNDLVYNPDPATFDSGAVNIVAAKDYVDAADKYVTGYCDPARALVKNGHKTQTTVRVCVDGVSTWTPADVKAAKGRGGLTRLASTHQYTGIMPNVMIVLNKWAQEHRDLTTKAVAAIGEAGNQLVNRPEALRRGCEISAQVYAEETPEFWCKYYKGTTEPDAKGQPVQLGGSRVSTLADVQNWFGLRPGAENIFGRTYTTFGNMLIEHYPEQMKSFPPVNDVLDISYVQAALQAAPQSVAEQQHFTQGVSGAKVAKKAWHINFKTGSADLTPQAQAQLEDLLNDLVTGGGALAIEVQGHTDSQGNPDKNQQLSEARAFKVKSWLEAKAPANFPQDRITPRAFGQTQPVASNATEAGRAQNRRVDIVLRESQ